MKMETARLLMKIFPQQFLNLQEQCCDVEEKKDSTSLPGIKSEPEIARTWEKKALVEFPFECPSPFLSQRSVLGCSVLIA